MTKYQENLYWEVAMEINNSNGNTETLEGFIFLENKWCGLSKIPGELVLRGGRAGLVFCRSNCISNISNISDMSNMSNI